MNKNEKMMHKAVLELRPLDFLYDSTYTIPTERNFNKTATHAVRKISEKNLHPCFNSMFSDISRYPRIHYVYKMENIPMSWEVSGKNTSQNEGINGRNIAQYVARSTSDVLNELRLEQLQPTSAHKICINGINDDTNHVEQIPTKVSPKKRKTVRTRSTQTDYRDSETQTDVLRMSSYTIVNDDNKSEVLFLASGSEGDINLLEDNRKITNLEQKLSKSRRNLGAQIAITKQIQRIKWLIKEKRIDYVNEIRMEYAENTWSEHKLQTQTTVTQREETKTQGQEMLKNQKLESLRSKKERELRKVHRKNQSIQYTSMLLEPI